VLSKATAVTTGSDEVILNAGPSCAVSHVVEAVKDRHEILAFPGELLGFRYFEGDTGRFVPGSHE
jgi:hypothetical protein